MHEELVPYLSGPGGTPTASASMESLTSDSSGDSNFLARVQELVSTEESYVKRLRILKYVRMLLLSDWLGLMSTFSHTRTPYARLQNPRNLLLLMLMPPRPYSPISTS